MVLPASVDASGADNTISAPSVQHPESGGGARLLRVTAKADQG
jgi:hypothetical protein